MTGGTEFQEAAEAPREIQEVTEAKEQLDRAAFEPEEVVEKTGEIKESETLQDALKASVDAIPVVEKAENPPAITLEGSDQTGKVTIEKGTDEPAEEGQIPEERTTEVKEAADPALENNSADVKFMNGYANGVENQSSGDGGDGGSDGDSKSRISGGPDDGGTPPVGTPPVGTPPDDSSSSPSSDEEIFRPEAAAENVGEAADGARAAAVENQTIPDEISLDSLGDESQADDGLVLHDPDGSDGSPEIDFGGLETTDDIREPTGISDAYAGGMGDTERGESVGYQGGEPADGLEIPGGLDGDLPGGIDGMPGGIDGMPGGLDGDLPGRMDGDQTGGIFNTDDPSWSPGGESDNTDFVSAGDLAEMAAPGGDDTVGLSTIRTITGKIWGAITGGGSADSGGGGGGGVRGTPDPEGGSGGSTPLPGIPEFNPEDDSIDYFESLTQPGGTEESSNVERPLPMTMEEIKESEVDPLINWGDDHDEDDEEFVGSQPDVDITPVDPPDMAGGGEGIEDSDGISEGFEDIDP